MKTQFIIKILLLFLLLQSSQTVLADGELRYDRDSKIEVRMPTEQSVEEFKNNRHFQYDQKIRSQNTWWDRLKYKFWQWFFKLFSNNGVYPYIRYLIIIIAAIFIVVKLMQTNLRSVFYRPKKRLKIEHKELIEDITKIDLNKLRTDAEKKGNFRLAIRYNFLATLKILKDLQMIDWKIDKTNRDYVVELCKEMLKNTEIKEKFEELSSVFEHVWYGNFEVSEAEYQNYKTKFNDFQKKL